MYTASHNKPSVKDIVKSGKPINLFQLQYAATGKMPFMAAEDAVPQAGVTYIPPLTLSLTSKAPTKFRSSREMSQANSLPESFSWNNDEDVRKYKNEKLVGIILKAGNQYTCGSCWAWAVSTSVSDRIGIYTGVNPQLGPSYLLSYSVKEYPFYFNNAIMGCNGGVLDAGLESMSDDSPGVKRNCWSYDWCVDNDSCNPKPHSSPSHDMDYMNTIIPSYDKNKGQCLEKNESFESFRVKYGSVYSFDSIESIKLSIFEKGPLPTGYFVFMDFMLGSKVPKGQLPWKETKGIYIHLQPDPIDPSRSVKGDPIFYRSIGDPYTLSQSGGGHAVVIVGWGVEEFDSTDDNFMQVSFPEPHTKVKIPYWIARNSWSERWAENGFFRIAMTNKRYAINTDIFFDDNAKRSGGGPMEFDIDTSGLTKLSAGMKFQFSVPVETDSDGCRKICKPEDIRAYQQFTSYNDVDLFKVGVVITLIVITAFFIYLYVQKK